MEVDGAAAEEVSEVDFMAAAADLFAKHRVGNGKGDAAELKRASAEIASGLWTMERAGERPHESSRGEGKKPCAGGSRAVSVAAVSVAAAVAASLGRISG